MVPILLFTAPVKLISPEKVVLPVNVLSPARVCAVVERTPPKVAEAGCSVKVDPEILAPLAFGVLPILASELTPEDRQILPIAKQPFVKLIPPVLEKEEVAVVKIIPFVLPIDKRPDGVVVPTPTFPLLSTFIRLFPVPSAIIILLASAADNPVTFAPSIVLLEPVVIPRPVLFPRNIF